MKADVAAMEARVKAAGGLSADTELLTTANELVKFMAEHDQRGRQEAQNSVRFEPRGVYVRIIHHQRT